MAGLYYEPFSLTQVFRRAVTRTVTEMDNTLFSVMTLKMQPLHLNARFSEQTEFGQRLVNSLFTLGQVIGISVTDPTLGTTIANLGMSDIRFPKSVLHGDSMHVETEMITFLASKSQLEPGIGEFEHRGFNHRDELTWVCRRSAFMKRQPAAA